MTLLDIQHKAIAYAPEGYERGDVEFLVGWLSAHCPPRSDHAAVVCTEVLEHVWRSDSGVLLSRLCAAQWLFARQSRENDA